MPLVNRILYLEVLPLNGTDPVAKTVNIKVRDENDVLQEVGLLNNAGAGYVTASEMFTALATWSESFFDTGGSFVWHLLNTIGNNAWNVTFESL